MLLLSTTKLPSVSSSYPEQALPVQLEALQLEAVDLPSSRPEPWTVNWDPSTVSRQSR